MTDRTQPEALDLADVLEAVEGGWSVADKCCAELRRQHARIAELEAQLESIGAGGVSGPLMGQPQAMPDLSALTERGAKAWTAVDAQALREGRWYMVTHDGVATLCEDRRDAEKEAKDADMAWPHSGPHRAVQLVEASTAGFTAADMATAEARGFRDGVASPSANAGEPFGWVKQSEIDSSKQFGGSINLWRRRYDCDVPVYLAAPPTAQAEGWRPIETAPKDGKRILVHPAIEVADAWSKAHWSAQNECWIVGGSPSGVLHTAWHPLPPPPTSAEGVEHG